MTMALESGASSESDGGGMVLPRAEFPSQFGEVNAGVAVEGKEKAQEHGTPAKECPGGTEEVHGGSVGSAG